MYNMDSDKNLKNHKKIQKQLIDVYYGEKELSGELKAHISACPICTKYWNELKTLDSKLDVLEAGLKVEMDMSLIETAFEEADKIKRRKERKEFVAFLFVAAILLTLESKIALSGYGVHVIMFQLIILVLVAPICVPFIFSKRIKKEAESK